MNPTDLDPDNALPPPLTTWARELPNLALIWSSPIRRVRVDPVEVPATGSEGKPPVLVFPGILSSDAATSLMRRTLLASGYRAYPAKMGLVKGVTPQLFQRAENRLDEVFSEGGGKVTLIGISLGGLFARVLAQRHPDKVRMVMTLGTPFSGNRRANNAWRVYEAINDHTVDQPPLPDDPSQKPPVRTIAVWSPRDGVVSPVCSRGLSDQSDRQVEVPDRHFQFSASRGSISRVLSILNEEMREG